MSATTGLRRGTAVACQVVVVSQATADAGQQPRQSSKNYTAPAGVTNAYPQMFLDHNGANGNPVATDGEVVGGFIGGARKNENRFLVKAVDATGHPVALSLYWYDDLKRTNRYAVVCGGTARPLPIVPGTGVHALVTAGGGCRGAVSAPTRGTITFTWSHEAPRRTRR